MHVDPCAPPKNDKGSLQFAATWVSNPLPGNVLTRQMLLPPVHWGVVPCTEQHVSAQTIEFVQSPERHSVPVGQGAPPAALPMVERS